MQHRSLAFALAASFFVMGASANAKPNVILKLDAELVQKDAKGVEKLTPVSGNELKPGETVRYDIVATNTGTDPAAKLMPVGKVPTGTTYEPGSATASNALRVEFSIDGGKTWSKSPVVKVVTQSGTAEKKADPATYTSVRWIAEKPLAPKTSVSYHYEVRVK